MIGAFRVWIDTLWFMRFWQVKRSFARHLALQNESDRKQRIQNGLPPRARGTWVLLRELCAPSEKG